MTIEEAQRRLRVLASEEVRRGYARFGIPTEDAIGIGMSELRKLAKDIGTDTSLALDLWDSAKYEARLLAGMIADPNVLSRDIADAWIAEFDNWATADTLCFDLLAFTPYRWDLAASLAHAEPEFQRRTCFALVWALTRKDRDAPDEAFREALTWMERAATDPRTYVWKAVDMALRATGKRNRLLHANALSLAERLAASPDRTAAKIGRSGMKDLSSSATERRLARNARRG